MQTLSVILFAMTVSFSTGDPGQASPLTVSETNQLTIIAAASGGLASHFVVNAVIENHVNTLVKDKVSSNKFLGQISSDLIKAPTGELKGL